MSETFFVIVFSGKNDATKCFCCGKTIGHWEKGDNPLEEHVKWYPDCRYAKEKSMPVAVSHDWLSCPCLSAISVPTNESFSKEFLLHSNPSSTSAFQPMLNICIPIHAQYLHE